MKRMMTVKQAAEIFFEGEVSTGLIYKEIKKKSLPHVKLSTGKILLDVDSLDEWWNEQLARSTVPGEMVGKVEPLEFGKLRRIAE